MVDKITLPTLAWTPDEGAFGSGMTMVRGMVPHHEGYMPLGGWKRRANLGASWKPTDYRVRGHHVGVVTGHDFIVVDNVAGSLRHVLKYNGSSVTDLGSFNPGGPAGATPYFIQYGPYVVILNGNVLPPKIIDEAGIVFPTLTNLHAGASAPYANVGFVLDQFLFLGNIGNLAASTDPLAPGATADPDLLWCSGYDTIRDFNTAGTGQSGRISTRDNRGPVSAAVGGKDWAAVFKWSGIYRIELDTYFPFRKVLIPGDWGTLYPFSTFTRDQVVYFWGPRGPAGFDGARAFDLGRYDQTLQDPFLHKLGENPAPVLGADDERVALGLTWTDWGEVAADIVGWYDPSSDKGVWIYQGCHVEAATVPHNYARAFVYDFASQRASCLRWDWPTHYDAGSAVTDGLADIAGGDGSNGLVWGTSTGRIRHPIPAPLWTPFGSTRVAVAAGAAANSRFWVLETGRDFAAVERYHFDAGRATLRWPYLPHEDGEDYFVDAVRVLLFDAAGNQSGAAFSGEREMTVTVRGRKDRRGPEDDTHNELVRTTFPATHVPVDDGWYVLGTTTSALAYQQVEVEFDVADCAMGRIVGIEIRRSVAGGG